MNYYSSDTVHEAQIYRTNRDTDWYQVEEYPTRGDQLLAAAKIMDEGYEFDNDGNKVQVGRVELIRKEVLTHEVQ
jgi:hypothetical protein